jgi:ABC-type Fe3+ transport system substrate-binding protein
MSKNQTPTAQKLIVSALRLANLRTAMLLSLTIVWSGFLSSALAAELKEKAEAEGKVILYASMSGEHCKVFSDAFKQMYPKSDAQFYSAASSPLAERILTESRSGRFAWDVLIITPFYTQLFMKRGFIAPYESPERKFYRDGYKDPKGMWTSIYTNYSVLVITQSLPSTKVPRSHFDLSSNLSASKWHGQSAMNGSPLLLMQWAREGFRIYAIARTTGTATPDRQTLVSQLVAAGETALALTSFSSNFESIKNRGAPVDWVALDPVIGYLHPIALSAKAPNPNAARLFIDFFLSKRGQEIAFAAANPGSERCFAGSAETGAGDQSGLSVPRDDREPESIH